MQAQNILELKQFRWIIVQGNFMPQDGLDHIQTRQAGDTLYVRKSYHTLLMQLNMVNT